VPLIPALFAEIYYSLAEVLGQSSAHQVPEWIALTGVAWPLYTPVLELAEQQLDPELNHALGAIEKVRGGLINDRQEEYESLIVGKDRPPIWLYESYYVDGRVPGPSTFAVKKLYSQAGLEVASSELPDHASMELAFLAFLAENEAAQSQNASTWRFARQLFIKKHAGLWLTSVAQNFSDTQFPAWTAIGKLMRAVLIDRPSRKSIHTSQIRLPAILHQEGCHLCGFCIQECPTRALKISETQEAVSLRLTPGLCSGCGKCIRVCPEYVLSLSGEFDGSDTVMLRKSPRSICPGCGQLTVSEAEMDLVATRLGHPEYVAYCLECR
jgi:TorA maturation chaperone TorD/Fe-S-cluster-containing hydrogenase component 2